MAGIFDKDFWESPSGQYIKGAGANVLDSFTGGLGSWFLNNIDYNRNNEYNSPVNQKQRLLAAGLSAPAADSAIAGSSQMATASTAASSNGNSSLGHYIALQELALHRKEVAASVENIESQTRKNDAEIARFNALTPVEVKKMSQEIRESVSRENLNGANKRLVEITADRLELMTPLEIQQLEQLIKKTQSEVLLNHQTIRNLKAEKDLIKANTAHVHIDSQLKENSLRIAKLLNVDPNSPWFMQAVQSIANGDSKPLDAILNGIWSIQTGMYRNVRSGIDHFLDTFF